MAVQAGLRMSFHNLDVADDEFNTDTEMCESHGSEQERQKDNLSESDIFQQFLELWHEKGELLIYKAFVTRFPDCALWYDQISGSIPPETEIQIVTSEMFDSCTDTSNKEHLFGESGDKELVCYSTNDKEHLYSNANNKEHFHRDKNNKENFHVDRDSQEHLQHGDNEEEILCRGLQIETPQHEHCEGQLGMHFHSDVDVNVCEVTSVDKQFCGNECTHDDCGSLEEVCYESSNIIHSKLYQNDSCLTELPAAGEVTPKHNIISEADVPTGGHFTEPRDFPFQAGNCSNSVILFDNAVSSVSDATSFADSAKQSAVEEDNISDRLSDPGSESAVQLLSHNEHCYTSRSCDDHSYTSRADLPYSSGHCQDYCTDDEQDVAEEFGPGELIARLQEAHEDLRHQVFVYVREIFSEWVRANPGEEFDVSSLDQYLLAVATPFMEVEFVYEQ